MKDQVIRFSVSLPQKLLDILDEKVKEQNYASRSEFTRDLIREKSIQDTWSEEEGEVIGVLSYIYNPKQKELMERLFDLQIKEKDAIMCTTKIHLEHDHILETLQLKGDIKVLRELVKAISGLKGVKFSQLIKAAQPKD